MAKGTYTYEYNDEHGNYTIRKFVGTNIAYKIYDTYDGEKDTPEKAMQRSVEERKAQGKDVSFLEKRLKDKPEAKETNEKEDNGEPKLEYQTNFHLEAPVNDFDAAQEYLSSDDMTQYIPEELQDVVKDVKWELDDEESGHISFKTTRELTAEESKKMSDWIDGQNSDGLGEGFEQQDFAMSYYDPYSGDGPYTYDEYQREIENRYDNLEPSEYADYLSDDAIEGGIQSWMEENEVDHIETDEEYERARQDVIDDPESYIDWEDIDAAKNDYMNDNEDLQEDHWFNMSSMRTNKGTREQNEFEISDIEPERTTADMEKEIDEKGYDNVSFTYDDYHKQAQTERAASEKTPQQNTRDQLSEKGYNIKEGELINYKDKDGNSKTGTFYGVGPEGEVYMKNSKGDWEVFATDINDVSDRTKASSIAREFLNPDNEYTDAWLQQQAQENGIEIADLDREIGRQMREGGMSYGQRKSETANSADRAQRIIDNDEWYDVTVDQKGTKATLKDERTGETVELDPYDSDDVIKSKLNELRPTKDIVNEYGKQAAKEDLDRTVDNFVKNNPRWEEGIYDETEADEMFEKNGARTWDVVYDRIYEKEHTPKTSEEAQLFRWRDNNDQIIQPSNEFVKQDGGSYIKQNYDGSSVSIDSARQGDGTVNYYRTDYDKYGEVTNEAVYKSLEEAQGKKTTNETMNEKIREGVTSKNARKNFKSDYEYKNAKNEPEWTKANKKALEENFKKDTGLEPYFKDGREKIIFQDYQTWSYGQNANKYHKGIKTIAKEYYGAGWNDLSANQKQQWIDRNETWLRAALEKAKNK